MPDFGPKAYHALRVIVFSLQKADSGSPDTILQFPGG